MNTVSLGALRAVATVARLGTIRAAAGALNVTPGAVSQQVLKAEAQLGRTLFERSPTGLTLTDMGSQVAALLEDGFNRLDQAVALTRSPEDRLTVSVAPVFAARWLVPRLPELEAQAGGLRVNVDATARYVAPGASGIDACLRVASKSAIAALGPDLTAIWLADQQVFPVCAPKLAQNIRSVSDLRSIPVIIDQNTTLDWDIWLEMTRLTNDQLQRGTTYSDASLCIDAAISGGGVFLAWDMLAVDALHRGTLVRPFEGVAVSGLSYWLIRQKRSNHPKRLRQLEEWLEGAVTASIRLKQ